MTVCWKGLRIVPSYSALREIVNLRLDEEDLKQILEHGYDCEKSRGKGIMVRCLARGKRVTKIVVVKSYQRWSKERIWLITT